MVSLVADKQYHNTTGAIFSWKSTCDDRPGGIRNKRTDQKKRGSTAVLYAFAVVRGRLKQTCVVGSIRFRSVDSTALHSAYYTCRAGKHTYLRGLMTVIENIRKIEKNACHLQCLPRRPAGQTTRLFKGFY